MSPVRGEGFGGVRSPESRRGDLVRTVADLVAALRERPSTLLYLSSGPVLPEFDAMPYGLILLVDRRHRTGREGRTFRLGLENSEALALLRHLGVRVDCLLAVCDGCFEGGNPECSYGPSGLGRLLPLLTADTLWITDHARPGKRLGLEVQPAELPAGAWVPRGWYGPLRSFRAAWTRRSPLEFRRGGASLRVLHDTVCHHLQDLDGVLLPGHMEPGHPMHRHLAPLAAGLPCGPRPRVDLLPEGPQSSILAQVQRLQRSGVRRLGVLPCFRPHGEGVVQELLDHGLGGLEAITFFHLDRSDFGALRRRARD